MCCGKCAIQSSIVNDYFFGQKHDKTMRDQTDDKTISKSLV